jgi:hypothetical protein
LWTPQLLRRPLSIVLSFLCQSRDKRYIDREKNKKEKRRMGEGQKQLPA